VWVQLELGVDSLTEKITFTGGDVTDLRRAVKQAFAPELDYLAPARLKIFWPDRATELLEDVPLDCSRTTPLFVVAPPAGKPALPCPLAL
jgi:hypothetical protein